MSSKRLVSVCATLLLFGLAALLVRSLWLHYMDAPWSRDGRVRGELYLDSAVADALDMDLTLNAQGLGIWLDRQGH